MSSVFDVCIVGAGMFGSAAAWRAVNMKQDGRSLTVCMIGPDEPQDRKDQTIFGAYYDEGRITRSTALEQIWATLSQRSITRYRDLEQQTGISFYEEVGCLTIVEPSVHLYAGSNPPRRLDSNHLHTLFPYLFASRELPPPTATASPTSVAFYETQDAGYVNPRRLCHALQTAAMMGGCHVIRDVVCDVTPFDLSEDESKSGAFWLVKTDGGREVLCRKVLVATGAFTEFRHLLPVRLDLRQMTQSVIFVELSPDDIIRLRNMPSMLIKNSPDKLMDSTSNSHECYILPPIRYPDGRTYIKLGHGSQCELELKSTAEITAWYLDPVPPDFKRTLQTVFNFVFTDIQPVSVHYDTCVTTNTENRCPFIDLLSPNFGIALGGNGRGAKACIEIGRLAIELLVNGSWTDDEIPRHLVTAVRL